MMEDFEVDSMMVVDSLDSSDCSNSEVLGVVGSMMDSLGYSKSEGSVVDSILEV